MTPPLRLSNEVHGIGILNCRRSYLALLIYNLVVVPAAPNQTVRALQLELAPGSAMMMISSQGSHMIPDDLLCAEKSGLPADGRSAEGRSMAQSRLLLIFKGDTRRSE